MGAEIRLGLAHQNQAHAESQHAPDADVARFGKGQAAQRIAEAATPSLFRQTNEERMTPPEGTNAHLIRAYKRVMSAIEPLADEEQDRVLRAAITLLGYSRPTTIGEPGD